MTIVRMETVGSRLARAFAKTRVQKRQTAWTPKQTRPSAWQSLSASGRKLRFAVIRPRCGEGRLSALGGDQHERPKPAIDDWPPRRSAASLKRTLVASAVSKLLFVRREIDVDVVAIGVAQMELYKPDRVQHEPLMWNGLFA